MSLERFLRKRPIVAAPEESCAAVAGKMREHHVGAVVIVMGERPVGIVTDRDLVARVLAQGLPPELPVGEAMTPRPITVRTTDSIDAVAFAMRQSGVRRVPIVAPDGTLAGIVTLDDLYVLLSAELSTTAQAVVANRGP